MPSLAFEAKALYYVSHTGETLLKSELIRQYGESKEISNMSLNKKTGKITFQYMISLPKVESVNWVHISKKEYMNSKLPDSTMPSWKNTFDSYFKIEKNLSDMESILFN